MKILRGNGPPAPRRDFAPSARRIEAERWDARREAEQIIATARAEAASIARRAEEEGRARAHAEAATLLIAAKNEAARVAERATDLVVTATKAVAERALGHALSNDSLAAWAKSAIATFGSARRIVVRANAAALPRLHELGVELIEDDLPDHTLIVLTELGDARVELRTQVDLFVESIRDVLASEVRRRA